MKKIWIDCSIIDFHRGPANGIPKTLVKIIEYWLKNKDEKFIFYKYNINNPKVFEIATHQNLQNWCDEVGGDKSSTSKITKVLNYKIRIKNKLVKILIKLKLSFIILFIKKFRTLFSEGISKNNIDRLCDKISEGDVFFSPGAMWITPEAYSFIEQLKKQKKIKFTCILYDLIPYKFPEYYPHQAPVSFNSWLKWTVSNCDLYFAISENTKEDLISLLSVSPKNIKVIRLGDNPGLKQQKKPKQLNFLNSKEFVFCVGTLEIRKNHTLLLKAWDKLIVKYGAKSIPNLIFVGSDGWLVEWPKHYMNQSNNLKESVFHFTGITDEELEYFYHNCLFTLYPSYYEGWGLPVAESLARGKFCIASSSSSIPEIGGDLVDYHDPNDLYELIDTLENHLFDPKKVAEKEQRIKNEYVLTDWNKMAFDIFKDLESLS